MADRNRTLITIPEGLRWLIHQYQNDRELTSFNAALVELLETHPAIAHRVYTLYTRINGESEREE